jgi:hypothetical protein
MSQLPLCHGVMSQSVLPLLKDKTSVGSWQVHLVLPSSCHQWQTWLCSKIQKRRIIRLEELLKTIREDEF